jgi:FdhD protein
MNLKDRHHPHESEGVKPTRFISVGVGSPKHIQAEIVDEALACISVNGQELATFMCTPRDLDAMALGFLFNENLIKNLDEVVNLRVSEGKTCVDVWLQDTHLKLPTRMVLTAGCGGGVTFDDLSKIHKPLQSDLRATPQVLADLFRKMHLGADLYQRARGIHTAAIANQREVLLQVEDVGRHNCLDKLAGKALMTGLITRGNIVLSSGRISSEMINKARRMETPIICSRTSPTSLSVALAETWNMTIVAYLRQERMRIYTHPKRILDDLPAGWEESQYVELEEIHSYD